MLKKTLGVLLKPAVFTLLCIVLLAYILFFTENDIIGYDRPHFTIVQDISDYEMQSEMMAQIVSEKHLDYYLMNSQEWQDEFYKKIKPYLHVFDLSDGEDSEEQILLENIWIGGGPNSKSSDHDDEGKINKYVIIYKNRKVRYILGKISTIPTSPLHLEYFEKLTGNKIIGNNEYEDFCNTCFIEGKCEIREDRLSLLQYFILLNKLKLVSIFPEENKEFSLDYHNDFTAGLYYNNTCYEYSSMESLRFDPFYKSKLKTRYYCDSYINKCIRVKDDSIVEKRKAWEESVSISDNIDMSDFIKNKLKERIKMFLLR